MSADTDARLLLLQYELRHTTFSSWLYSFPAASAAASKICLRNNSRDVGFGKPRPILAVYPNLQALSALQCDAKPRVALHLLASAGSERCKSPSPGVAGGVMEERGSSRAERG